MKFVNMAHKGLAKCGSALVVFLSLIGTGEAQTTCYGRTATAGCNVNGVSNQPCLESSGNDNIIGATGNNVIIGLEGNDRLIGRAGKDAICGGGGEQNVSYEDETGGGNGIIPPAGGSIELPGVVKATFPPGAFATSTRVRIRTTSSPEVAAAFNDFASIFRPANRLAYEIRINTGLQPPVSDTIRVEIAVPDNFLSAVPADHQIELFAQLLNDGGEETIDLFELFDATFDASTKTIIAELPTAIFSTTRNSTGDFEAIITLASTPGVNRTVPAISPLSSDTNPYTRSDSTL